MQQDFSFDDLLGLIGIGACSILVWGVCSFF